MAQYDYDLFVIGAGSGGVRAARMSAQYGARVAIAEQRYLGGTCVNVGCVPKKLLVYASAFSEEFVAARGFGWDIPQSPIHSWQKLINNKNSEISRLNGVYRELLKNSGVDLYESRATIAGPHRIEVAGKSVSARYVLIATGGWPFIPDIPGKDLAITSNEAFFLDQLPDKIVIVGGGYIAMEFAGIFSGLGVETHLVYRGQRLLRHFDHDLSDRLASEMQKRGVTLHLNTDIDILGQGDCGEIVASLNTGKKLMAGAVMYATGRRPNTDRLGLDNTVVRLNENGSIIVDDNFQTAEPSIYAIGDVIDRLALTPVAIAEGMSLAAALFDGKTAPLDYTNIPTAVFSQPNLACVGLTEHQARAKFGDIQVYKSEFRPMKQTLGGGDELVFMKLLVDQLSNRVVGCHMMGDHAGEIIQGLAVAMRAGATKADFDETVGIHPTVAEEFVTMRTPVSE